MKFTLSWLKEHLDTDASPDQISTTLTMLGHEVEGIEDPGEGLRDFVVGHVVEAVQHPNADKLRLCTVDTGNGQIHQVVCGAPNARTGMYGVFAREGLYIPGTGITLKPTEIRGVESKGMLLSEREMGLSDAHDGIVELHGEPELGAPAVDVMGLNDPLIDIAITPNRGDCLGVRGVARDLAAAGLGTLKPLDTTPVPAAFQTPVTVNLNFDEASKDACPYFVGRHFRNVKNGESPDWLKARLLAIGLRPISILVDITNLVTFDLCRPLHVFDMKTLKGNVQARLAKQGETLMALDGKEYTLDATMTVIADDEKAEAIAGVMGGEESGCTLDTTEVFLEVAYFDPIRTAATGRTLNLQSDARYRFERGVDPAFMIHAVEIATRLILDLCGGECSQVLVAGAPPLRDLTLPLRHDRVRSLGGLDLPAAEVERILTALEFGVDKTGSDYRVAVPSWRHDVVGEACLVEEVVRVHGYDNIPAVSLERTSPLPETALTADQRQRAMARRLLATRGLVEAMTYSFMPAAQADLFGGVPDSLRLVNPISADLDVMRPSILANLIAAAGRNADRGIPDADLFELGPVYAGDAPKDQEWVATGIRVGKDGPRHWARPPRTLDALDAKADVMAVLTALGAPVDKAQVKAEAPAWYHPGRSAVLQLGPHKLASFGEIHPGVLARMDVKGPIVGFEIYLDRLPKQKARKSAAKPHLELSALQPVERDFAFLLDGDVPAEKLIAAAKKADPALITDVRVFDVFTGESLGENRKSVAIGVTLQPTEKTLTDADLEALSGKLVESVIKATGGTLRG